jgi:hypothetical protein
MAKQKERSELEILRSENRRLKSIAKHLKKEASRKTKREHLHNDLVEKQAEELLKEELKERDVLKGEGCPNCGEELDITDIGPRKLYTCDCGYRKSAKK